MQREGIHGILGIIPVFQQYGEDIQASISPCSVSTSRACGRRACTVALLL
jgi:hypothetical protein